jgi:signal transduction histidine kinase
MQGTMYDSLDDKAKELIDISGRNSELLLSLINDILDADRIESGKIDIHFDYIDIVAVIKDAVADMATYLPNKNLSYQLDLNKEHTIVRMDKNRIKQVMYNLLSNAAKFSHESSTILIQLRENADDVVISISNSGDPIPDKFTSLMFHRFSQADNTSARMASGSGLGLYITKSIIDLHNGEIGYESIENKTTFWFTLPKADQDALSNS